MATRHMTYLSCDCCGDPSEAANSAQESREVSGYTRRYGLDICSHCQGHTEPCAEWLRQLLKDRHQSPTIERGWAKIRSTTNG